MKEQVAEIVAAYVKKNPVPADQLPATIATVYAALAGLGNSEPAVAPTPAVPIRRSVGPETIICLDCGRKAKMLKRHLLTAHAMTVDEYRTRWALPPDYPMVARNYSERRSALAKTLGLGRRGSQRKGKAQR